MSDLTNLYQDQILEFARQARQSQPIAAPDAQASTVNPSCGDQVDIALMLERGTITALSAETKGCAICEASTGFALRAMTNIDQDHALSLPQKVKDALTKEVDMPLSGGEAFHAIRPFKSRHTCVLLVYEAVAQALQNKRSAK